MRRLALVVCHLAGALAGMALGFVVQIRWFATPGRLEARSSAEVLQRLVLGSVGGAAVALAWLLVLAGLLRAVGCSRRGVSRFLAVHALSLTAPAGYLLYANVYEKTDMLAVPFALAFFAATFAAVVLLLEDSRRDQLLASRGWLALLFFLSGIAALVYQITWQRALFASFGINIESVTVVVTVFMLGLGLGSLLGGRLSRRAPERLPAVFLTCELAIGVFGLVSLPLIHGMAGLTTATGVAASTAAVFILLLPPTLVMGATLPVLVDYLNSAWKHVGRSVGLLYFINTLGSAAACFLTADVLFALGGQRVAVAFAAGCNLLVGLLVFTSMRCIGRAEGRP